MSRQEAAWSFTEAANEPFFSLVQRYVFAPYFTGTLAAGQAEGASAWGLAIGSAGVMIAILAPTLGSIADGGARKKPWVIGLSLLAALASAMLWFATPGMALWPVLLAVVLATVAFELTSVFTNAYLPQVAPVARMGLLSGINFGVSQLAGIAALLLVLWAGNSGVMEGHGHGVDRLTGPIAAVAALLFLLPLLLVMRERDDGRRPSVGRGLRDLRATLADAWRNRDMRWFLIGRMLGADGMAVVFTFGAVLAAASFGWKAATMAVFGLVITVFGVVGGFLGGLLDRWLGARNLTLLGLALVFVGAASVILTDSARLFGIPTGVALSTPLASPQEWGFLGAGAVIATGAAFALSAMRTLLAKLAPPDRMTAYFGLYAFVGKATAFAGPLMVSAVAYWTGSIRVSIVVALVLLAAGFAALLRVRSPIGEVT